MEQFILGIGVGLTVGFFVGSELWFWKADQRLAELDQQILEELRRFERERTTRHP
jgi:hypothetical protein